MAPQNQIPDKPTLPELSPPVRPEPAASAPADWLGRAKAQPAKSVLTGALICVLAIMLVRASVRPRAASAGMPGLLLAPTVSRSLALSADAEQSLPALPSIPLPRIVQQVIPRDIFQTDLRRFPKSGGKSNESHVEAVQSDPAAAATSRLEQVKRLAGGLHLEGTVTGPQSVAFIDGAAVRVGEQCQGFRVLQIDDQSVLLERDGMRLELRMSEY